MASSADVEFLVTETIKLSAGSLRELKAAHREIEKIHGSVDKLNTTTTRGIDANGQMWTRYASNIRIAGNAGQKVAAHLRANGFANVLKQQHSKIDHEMKKHTDNIMKNNHARVKIMRDYFAELDRAKANREFADDTIHAKNMGAKRSFRRTLNAPQQDAHVNTHVAAQLDASKNDHQAFNRILKNRIQGRKIQSRIATLDRQIVQIQRNSARTMHNAQARAVDASLNAADREQRDIANATHRGVLRGQRIASRAAGMQISPIQGVGAPNPNDHRYFVGRLKARVQARKDQAQALAAHQAMNRIRQQHAREEADIIHRGVLAQQRIGASAGVGNLSGAMNIAHARNAMASRTMAAAAANLPINPQSHSNFTRALRGGPRITRGQALSILQSSQPSFGMAPSQTGSLSPVLRGGSLNAPGLNPNINTLANQQAHANFMRRLNGGGRGGSGGAGGSGGNGGNNGGNGRGWFFRNNGVGAPNFRTASQSLNSLVSATHHLHRAFYVLGGVMLAGGLIDGVRKLTTTIYDAFKDGIDLNDEVQRSKTIFASFGAIGTKKGLTELGASDDPKDKAIFDKSNAFAERMTKQLMNLSVETGQELGELVMGGKSMMADMLGKLNKKGDKGTNRLFGNEQVLESTTLGLLKLATVSRMLDPMGRNLRFHTYALNELLAGTSGGKKDTGREMVKSMRTRLGIRFDEKDSKELAKLVNAGKYAEFVELLTNKLEKNGLAVSKIADLLAYTLQPNIVAVKNAFKMMNLELTKTTFFKLITFFKEFARYLKDLSNHPIFSGMLKKWGDQIGDVFEKQTIRFAQWIDMMVGGDGKKVNSFMTNFIKSVDDVADIIGLVTLLTGDFLKGFFGMDGKKNVLQDLKFTLEDMNKSGVFNEFGKSSRKTLEMVYFLITAITNAVISFGAFINPVLLLVADGWGKIWEWASKVEISIKSVNRAVDGLNSAGVSWKEYPAVKFIIWMVENIVKLTRLIGTAAGALAGLGNAESKLFPNVPGRKPPSYYDPSDPVPRQPGDPGENPLPRMPGHRNAPNDGSGEPNGGGYHKSVSGGKTIHITNMTINSKNLDAMIEAISAIGSA